VRLRYRELERFLEESPARAREILGEVHRLCSALSGVVHVAEEIIPDHRHRAMANKIPGTTGGWILQRGGILYLLKGVTSDGDLECEYALGNEKTYDKVDTDLPWKWRSRPTTLRVRCIDGQTTTTELKRVFKKFGTTELGGCSKNSGGFWKWLSLNHERMAIRL
jgi:hypothetical protein